MNTILLNFCIKPLKTRIYAWMMLFIVFLSPQILNAEGLSPYSTKELEELEQEFIQQINLSDRIERNPLANQYINHLGKKLAQAGHVKTPYFFIVKSKEINAFAGPGGYIGINSQLILTSSKESELAAVMAHELAHVRLHHLYNRIEHQKQMRVPMLASVLASIALGAINPTLGMGALMGSYTGLTQDAINFTRSNEKEADRIGIAMLIKAGFDPQSMANFFKKMQEHSRYFYTANIPAILRTHPMDDDRIAEAQNRTQHLAKKTYDESLEYALFKESIRVSVTIEPMELINFYSKLCPKQNKVPLPDGRGSDSSINNNTACQYGYALTLLKTNQYQKAYDRLNPLLATHPNNIYIQVALAESELGLKQYPNALERLSRLHSNFPDNYAALMAYAQGLIAANEFQKATGLLLKGSRIYKEDLPLCKALARAQAQSNQKSYAYFTQAKCLLLEGQKRAAMRQLKLAGHLAKNDAYLSARIKASMEDIESMGHL